MAGEGKIFQGWFVAAAAFVVLFCAYGVQFSYGVFVTGMGQELGWSRADTALPYALYVFGYSVLSAVTGRATDRFGPRPVVATGALLLGCGWGASAFVTERWQLNLTLGLVASIGMSATWVPCNATVARWFIRRRATAVALATSGISFGNLVAPPLVALMVAAAGWRTTLAVLAAVASACILIAAVFMARDPESMGLHPDGDARPAQSGPVTGLTAREAMRADGFVLLTLIYLFNWLVIFVPLVHGAAFAEDLGLGKVVAASVISVIGLGGVVGRLFGGVLSDRVGYLPSLAMAFLCQSISFTLFATSSGATGLWLAALLFGLSFGSSMTVLAPLCSELFGRKHVASVVGVLFAIAATPSALGPWLAGWLYDATGGYRMAFVIAVGLNLVSLGLSLLLQRRRTLALT